MQNNAATQNFDKGTEKTGAAVAIITVISLLLNIVFQHAINKILGTISQLQIVINLALLQTAFPGNLNNFILKLKPIVTFNIVKIITQYFLMLFSFDVDFQNKVKATIMTPAKN